MELTSIMKANSNSTKSGSKVILVTGSNRSGSTWVGKVIESAGGVYNCIEPLNPNRVKRFRKHSMPVWYPKLVADQQNDLCKEVNAIYNYYLNGGILNLLISGITGFEEHKGFKAMKRVFQKNRSDWKLLKDPTALFCAPHLMKTFDAVPVIIIRHPAAYALSIKEKNWWFDFDNFLQQDHFFANGLENLKEEVLWFKKSESNRSIIENAALLWKVFYQQVWLYMQEYPDWIYVRHEDLSVYPNKYFSSIFNTIGLPFTSRTQEYLIQSTKAGNQDQDKWHRDSVMNAQKWKSILSGQEQKLILSIVDSVSRHYYPNPYSYEENVI